MSRCSHCGGTGIEPAAALFESTALVRRTSAIEAVPYEEAGSFDEFWRNYPRKHVKTAAVKSWHRMTHADHVAAIDALPSHVAMWEREGRGTRLIPHPASWLNQRRWEDDLSGYVDDSAPRKPMPGRTGIEAALTNRTQRAIGS